jgi:hypothetical protein
MARIAEHLAGDIALWAIADFRNIKGTWVLPLTERHCFSAPPKEIESRVLRYRPHMTTSPLAGTFQFVGISFL